jgi:hypothetical protein
MVAGTSRIFICAVDDKTKAKYWLVKYDTRRDARNVIEPWSTWSHTAAEAKPFSYATYQMIVERYRDAGYKEQLHAVLAANDNEPFIEDITPMPLPEDDRVPMHYRGVIAKPGIDVANGQRCWFVAVLDPIDRSKQLESVKGDTVESCINKAISLFGIEKLERYQVSVDVEPPPPVQSNKPSGWRSRPADRK